jgi:hypothetical protein
MWRYDETRADGSSWLVAARRRRTNAMTIPAKYENGVFKPLDQVQIEEGTMVEVYVPADPGRLGPRPRSVREFVFCGMWKDREDMADSVAYVNRLREDLRG